MVRSARRDRRRARDHACSRRADHATRSSRSWGRRHRLPGLGEMLLRMYLLGRVARFHTDEEPPGRDSGLSRLPQRPRRNAYVPRRRGAFIPGADLPVRLAFALHRLRPARLSPLVSDDFEIELDDATSASTLPPSVPAADFNRPIGPLYPRCDWYRRRVRTSAPDAERRPEQILRARLWRRVASGVGMAAERGEQMR